MCYDPKSTTPFVLLPTMVDLFLLVFKFFFHMHWLINSKMSKHFSHLVLPKLIFFLMWAVLCGQPIFLATIYCLYFDISITTCYVYNYSIIF